MSQPTLEEAYRRFFPVLREKCRRLLGDGDEASDVAQEAFVRLWRSGELTAPPRELAAWMHRTSVRLAIDHLRARRARAGWGEGLSALLPASSDAAELLHNRRALEVLAQRLPKELLEVALLHRADLLTQPEVAQVLRCSERTVRRLLERLDARLAKLREEGWS